jgi:predicted adenine nucleotide alpha hydrolase (AANH) superfamily ATPase
MSLIFPDNVYSELTVDFDLLLVTIIKSQYVMKSGYRSILNLSASHRLHVPNYCPCVASHLRLPHHDSALNRSASKQRR